MSGPTFEQILEECVAAIRSGESDMEECLARHPAERSGLQPLLEALAVFKVADSVQPAAAVVRRSRQRLDAFTLSHPRTRQPLLVRYFRLAGVAAAVALALLVPVSVRAQSALPRQSLYEWKLLTERIWHAATPDRVGVDLQLADRRLREFVAVSADPVSQAIALQGYEAALRLLMAESAPEDQERILTALTAHNELLGIVEPALASPDSNSETDETDEMLDSLLDLVPPLLPDLLP